MTHKKLSLFGRIKRFITKPFRRRYIAIAGKLWRYGKDGMFKGNAPVMSIGEPQWAQWCEDNDHLIWIQDGKRCTLRATMQARHLKHGTKVYRYWLGYRFLMGRHPSVVCYIGNIGRMTPQEIEAKIRKLHERRDKRRQQLEDERRRRRKEAERARRARYRARRRETKRRQQRAMSQEPWW